MAEPRRSADEDGRELAGARVLLVEARFYADIADSLLTGATRALQQAGVAFERVSVPGSLEIVPAMPEYDVRNDARPVLLYADSRNVYDEGLNARAAQLAAELGIRLVWLPKRCPKLNGMDHLWGHGKDHVCADRQHDDLDAEVERFIAYLRGLSNRDALRQAGLLSENFWLRL